MPEQSTKRPPETDLDTFPAQAPAAHGTGTVPATAPTLAVIQDFDPQNDADRQAFRLLNEEWITRHFCVEPTDATALADPEKKYLIPGGRIFLAFQDDSPVGCCALIRMSPGEYEISKMAVTPAARGRGLGRQILAHAVAEAWRMNAVRLYLETNSILAPAIHLYESLGFTHVPPDRLVRSPYARADTFMELFRS